MLRSLVLVLVALFPTLLDAAEPAVVPWQSNAKAAGVAALAQHKMVLVYYRGDCARCNDASDAMFIAAATDEAFAKGLESFIPLRIDSTSEPHPITDDVRKQRKAPLVAVYDASGVQLALLKGADLQRNAVGELLLRFRAARPFVVAAAGFRSKGDDGAAAYALGEALMAAREPHRAAEQYEIAATYFGAQRGEDRQFAELLASYARFAAGDTTRARIEVIEIVRKPLSDAVAAEAYYRLGAMSEARLTSKVMIANGPIATPTRPGQRMPGPEPIGYRSVTVTNNAELKNAIASYRKAYELAAPDSPTLQGARRALARLDDRPLPPKGGMTSTLRLLAPPRPALTGKTEFVAETAPGIERVDFFLDDQPVISRKTAPFRATIDVGPTARQRSVKALAFDGNGTPVAEAVLPINGSQDAFVISFIAPVSTSLRAAADVELDVRVPAERTLKRVELSWNGTPVATLMQPPFRSRVPAHEELGYLRAVGTLDDGSTTEVTKLFNTGQTTSVEVGAVTLIASVTDAAGKRIRGLGSRDFLVRDMGKPVAAELRSSEDDPVTIGLAIDSSTSMSGRQLYVINAAARFLGHALRPQDEAFVVSFDTGARLVHPRSKNGETLRASVLDLIPTGGTSIFDGVTFALQQLQDVPGKRALLVFSDGREGTSSASAEECGRLARAIGVPVYLIVPPGGENHDHALRVIAEATGGLLFYATPEEKLPSLFDQLADEVRGQYVLSFTRPAGTRSGEWRTLRVDVRGREANVRAIQGYRVY